MPLVKEKKVSINYYKLLPEGAPYQLIEGGLIMTPAPSPEHQLILGDLVEIFRNFVKEKGLIIFSPVDVYFDEHNALQPDLFYISRDRKHIIKKDGIYGPPDLIVEILSPATAHYDLKEKFRVYERSGVKEYWIVDPETRTVEIYSLKDGEFILMAKSDKAPELKSIILHGLTVKAEDIFKN